MAPLKKKTKKKTLKQGEVPQPILRPIPNIEFRMGWDRGWVMALPLVSELFEGWSMIGIP